MNKKDTSRPKALLTQINRDLQHFTDRHELTFRFAEYLNNKELIPQKILFFYGDGGNGKSLLLKFLRENCCKYFPWGTWQKLAAKPYPEAVELIKAANDWEWELQEVPAILLDFEPPPRRSQEENPQDPFDGLLMLHRQLVTTTARLGYKLSFPLYEFACILYLKHQGKLKNERDVTRCFPSAELYLGGGAINFIKILLELFKFPTPVNLAVPASSMIVTASLFNVIIKHFGKDLNLYLNGRGLKEEHLERIAQLDPNTELLSALPNFFAEDLKVAMQRPEAPEKLVLLFDTHEAFWGERRDRPQAVFFRQDEWLRCLLSQLLELPQLVIVMAGREIPRWHEARYCSIPRDRLECKQVLNFKATDALDYLQRVGIEQEELRESLIAYTSFDGDSVHPFLLGLCADLVRKAQERGEESKAADFRSDSQTGQAFNQKLGILVERLLKYTDRELEDAVYVLSACRSFDEELYFQLGETLKCNPCHAAFETLLGFSFVWPAEQQGQGRYRLHPLIRRLNHEQEQERTAAAHRALERYYRDRGNRAEALYHAYWQEPLRAKEEWIEIFAQANQQEDNELCQTLAEIRREIPF